MPIPDEQDPVSCQAHVNEVIKTIIIHHEAIFPSQRDLDGPVYEKCMAGGEEYWWVHDDWSNIRTKYLFYLFGLKCEETETNRWGVF